MSLRQKNQSQDSSIDPTSQSSSYRNENRLKPHKELSQKIPQTSNPDHGKTSDASTPKR